MSDGFGSVAKPVRFSNPFRRIVEVGWGGKTIKILGDATNTGLLKGPPASSALPSDKVTISVWTQASLLTENLDIIVFRGNDPAANSAKAWMVSFPSGGDLFPAKIRAQWDDDGTGAGIHNFNEISLGPLTHATGWVNVIFSMDNSIPSCSAAACYADLGPADDVYATGGSSGNIVFEDPFDPIIPFNTIDQTWFFQTGESPALSWATILIGQYYDLSLAVNRRLFNKACPSGATLTVEDTTALSPDLLMHGNKTAFLKNRIDDSTWALDPGSVIPPATLTDSADVPGCPP